LASIIVSQAIISASFSMVLQALSMGCFPNLKVIIGGKVHRGWLSSTSISDLLQLSDGSLVLGTEEGL
jgi:KUP system potassium uptake protein